MDVSETLSLQGMHHDQRFVLAPFGYADFDRIIGWIASEALLMQFAGPIFTFPLNRSQLQNYLHTKGRYPYKIIDQNQDLVIGHAEIYLTGDGVAWLCRILIGDKDYKGKGYCPQIMALLIQEAFSWPNIHQATLHVYDWNQAAIRCYEKAGFVVDEQPAKAVQVKGEEWQAIRMSLNR